MAPMKHFKSIRERELDAEDPDPKTIITIIGKVYYTVLLQCCSTSSTTSYKRPIVYLRCGPPISHPIIIGYSLTPSFAFNGNQSITESNPQSLFLEYINPKGMSVTGGGGSWTPNPIIGYKKRRVMNPSLL